MKIYITLILTLLLASCSPPEPSKDIWHLMSTQVFESTTGRIYMLGLIHDTGKRKMLVCVSNEETHNNQFEAGHFYVLENGEFHGISHIPSLEDELIKTLNTTVEPEESQQPRGHLYSRVDGKNIEIASGSDEEIEFLSILDNLDIRPDQTSQIYLIQEFKKMLIDRSDLISLESKK